MDKEKFTAYSFDTAEDIESVEPIDAAGEEPSEPVITTASYSFSETSHTESFNPSAISDYHVSLQDIFNNGQINIPSISTFKFSDNYTSYSTTSTATQTGGNTTTTSTVSSYTDENTTSTYSSGSTLTYESHPIEGYSNVDFKYGTSRDLIKSFLGLDLDTLIGDRINEVYNNIIRTFTDNDKTYTSSIFYDVGNGNGYISDFNNITDVLNFVNPNVVSLSRNEDQIEFNMADGTKFQATGNGSQDDIFQYSFDGINIGYAKLGFSDRDNGFTYADGITFFGTPDHEDTVFFATPNVNIDLNGSNFININNIDARNAEITSDFTRQLIGNALNNKIFASQGDELWGGAGDDELYGAGNNIFRYGVSDGKDVIYNSVTDDKVNLYNISVDDIISVDYNENNLNINFADGGSLKIVGENGASNFILSDNSAWKFNRETQSVTQTQPEQASVE